ncbi:PilZ domain-containing protein [Hyphococcus formosus]|uniref:PilZ domain-containing protein n=1 Tax=Hyphococcus formosus TaxID=3143534 RepID=UPI00398AA45D
MTNNTPENSGVSETPEIGTDRRKHHRAALPLKARFLTERGEERAGVVVNISAGGAILQTRFPPDRDQKVILYIDQIGRIEGKVVRTNDRAFAVAYPKKRSRQARIADHLTQALNNKHDGAERRARPRINQDTHATVQLEDGRTMECSILDISLTGASLEIKPRPPLGTHLILGRMTAKVVRRHDKGVGVVFTGSSERKMEDVLTDSASMEPFDTTGPGFAHSFGKKGVRAQ